MLAQRINRIGANAIADNPLPSLAKANYLNANEKANSSDDKIGDYEIPRGPKILCVANVLHPAEQDSFQYNRTRYPSPKSSALDAHSVMRFNNKVSDGSQPPMTFEPPMTFDLYPELNGWLPIAAPFCSALRSHTPSEYRPTRCGSCRR